MESSVKIGKANFLHTILFLFLVSICPVYSYAKDIDTTTKGYNKQYTFTQNWFTDRIPTWQRLLNELKGKPDVNYLEIGTFEGRSALWILENVLTHPTAKATIIDAFKDGSYKTFTSNLNLSGEASKFTIITGFSTEKMRELPFNTYDLAYVDGSGKGIVMLSDFINTWSLLKVGGIMICSRYELEGDLRQVFNVGPKDPGPVEAIDTFLKMYKPYIKVLAIQENQAIFRKLRD
jgi:predicted O-methyltransferase YrrM